MNARFVLEDEVHCEWLGEFATLAAARAELERLATLPWDEPPLAAPCTGWRACGREVAILEYDATGDPWRLVRREDGFRVDARGVAWGADGPPDTGG